MTLVCIHCGNHGQKQVYDQEKKDYELICMTCGRNKFEEDDNMSHKLCEVEGCKKLAVKDGMCSSHYKAKNGVTARPSQKGYKKPCSVEGCTKTSLTQDLCYHHLTEKHGGVNPYKYSKKVQKALSAQGVGKPPSAFVEVAPNVLVPKETKVLVDQINAIQPPATTPDMSGGNGSRAVAFNYNFTGGKLVFDRCAIEHSTHIYLNGSYDDWMFLGAIAAEIKRISEGG